MKLPELREAVFLANRSLVDRGLVMQTFGNVSGIDRASGVFAIKPSGVKYAELSPENMVLVDLEGKVVEGTFKPSSDTPTHLELYKAFATIGGVAHSHSQYATMWAQACRSIPALGTTHADYVWGDIPCTSALSVQQIEGEYEVETGRQIVKTIAERDPLTVPMVLVSHHGPFSWGKSAMDSAAQSELLEYIAKLAHGTVALQSPPLPIPTALHARHFFRKHGAKKYYGQ